VIGIAMYSYHSIGVFKLKSLMLTTRNFTPFVDIMLLRRSLVVVSCAVLVLTLPG